MGREHRHREREWFAQNFMKNEKGLGFPAYSLCSVPHLPTPPSVAARSSLVFAVTWSGLSVFVSFQRL